MIFGAILAIGIIPVIWVLQIHLWGLFVLGWLVFMIGLFGFGELPGEIHTCDTCEYEQICTNHPKSSNLC